MHISMYIYLQYIPMYMTYVQNTLLLQTSLYVRFAMRNIEAAAHTLPNIPAESQTDRQTKRLADRQTDTRMDGTRGKTNSHAN